MRSFVRGYDGRQIGKSSVDNSDIYALPFIVLGVPFIGTVLFGGARSR